MDPTKWIEIYQIPKEGGKIKDCCNKVNFYGRRYNNADYESNNENKYYNKGFRFMRVAHFNDDVN